MTRARILWLTKGLGRGGAERLLTGCARHVTSDRFDVEVAYVLPHKDAFVPELESLGVRAHCLGGGSAGDPRWIWRLRRLVAERRYDIVHTHMPVPAVAARMFLPFGATRLVHTEHNLWPRYRRLTRWSNALTYGRNDAVVAVSDAVAATITSRHAPRTTVLHHGIDTGWFRDRPGARAEARLLLGLPANAFVIGTVANFTPKKDHDTLLEAFARMRSVVSGAVLVLMGTGPLEARVRQRAHELGVADAVRFTGSRGDVDLLLPALDVFCLSSRQEGLPISMLEALACGVPVVATAVGGIPEVIRDGIDGRLVQPARPGLLAEALEKVAADPDLRAGFGRAGRTRIAAYDIAATQRAIESIYVDVLRSPR